MDKASNKIILSDLKLSIHSDSENGEELSPEKCTIEKESDDKKFDFSPEAIRSLGEVNYSLAKGSASTQDKSR